MENNLDYFQQKEDETEKQKFDGVYELKSKS